MEINHGVKAMATLIALSVRIPRELDIARYYHGMQVSNPVSQGVHDGERLGPQ